MNKGKQNFYVAFHLEALSATSVGNVNLGFKNASKELKRKLYELMFLRETEPIRRIHASVM